LPETAGAGVENLLGGKGWKAVKGGLGLRVLILLYNVFSKGIVQVAASTTGSKVANRVGGTGRGFGLLTIRE